MKFYLQFQEPSLAIQIDIIMRLSTVYSYLQLSNQAFVQANHHPYYRPTLSSDCRDLNRYDGSDPEPVALEFMGKIKKLYKNSLNLLLRTWFASSGIENVWNKEFFNFIYHNKVQWKISIKIPCGQVPPILWKSNNKTSFLYNCSR